MAITGVDSSKILAVAGVHRGCGWCDGPWNPARRSIQRSSFANKMVNG